MSDVLTALKIVKAHILKERVPLNVSYFITNKCDLRCSYCTIPETRGHHAQMTTAQTTDMLDAFHRLGMVKFSCSGGEPLLRPDLGEVMDHAASLGAVTSITTNARLLKKRAPTLKSIHTILVSLDGTPEFQKGTKTNEVEEILEGIDAVKTNGSRVWLSTVLLEGSFDQLDYLISVCRERGLKLLLQPFDNALIERQAFDRALDSRSLLDIFAYAFDEAPEIIANTPDYVDMIRDDLWLTPDMCLAGQRTCFIDSNGDVFPCLPILLQSVKTGNGLRDGWKEAFEGASMEGCYPCRFPCMAELYNTFSVKPRTWLHMHRMVRR